MKPLSPVSLSDIKSLTAKQPEAQPNEATEPAKPKKERTPAKPAKAIRVSDYLADFYEIRYNIVSNELLLREEGSKDFETLENEQGLWFELAENNIDVSVDLMKNVLIAKAAKFDPLRNYFENLPEKRGVIDEIARYVQTRGTPDPENPEQEIKLNFAHHLKKHLVRTVACALDESYFNKQCLVMIGGQNVGKSSFCEWFLPPALLDYGSSSFSFDKDGEIALGGNLLVFLDELANFERTDIKQLKAILAKQFIKVREPYGKKAIRRPRRASFFATTNEAEFLTDSTGNVRFVCIELEYINFNYSKEIDVDDVWAEAYTLYKSGYKGDLNKAEIAEIERINAQHSITCVETELIQRYFSKPDATNKLHEEHLTATEIKQYIQSYHPSERINLKKLGEELRRLIGRPVTARRGNQTPKGYFLVKNNS